MSVTLEPSYGIELGGTLVSVQGYCFSFQQNVQCDFDGTRVTALYESELIVHCVVPRLHHRGSVPFKLFVDDVMRGEAVYTACEFCSVIICHLFMSGNSLFLSKLHR